MHEEQFVDLATQVDVALARLDQGVELLGRESRLDRQAFAFRCLARLSVD